MTELSNPTPQRPTRKSANQDWEDFVEQKILQAQADGEFDQLPGFGKPIPSLEESYDENRWLREKLKREQLSALPPGLQLRLDIEKAVEQLWDLRDEQTLRSRFDEINQMIRERSLSITWGPPANVMPLDWEETHTRWNAGDQR